MRVDGLGWAGPGKWNSGSRSHTTWHGAVGHTRAPYRSDHTTPQRRATAQAQWGRLGGLAGVGMGGARVVGLRKACPNQSRPGLPWDFPPDTLSAFQGPCALESRWREA